MNKQPLHILLVEDEADHAEIVQVLLGQAWPGELQWTRQESLAETLERLSEQAVDPTPLDVMLLDLRLPDSMGIETLRQVLKRAISIPIIVLTSLDDGELGARAVSEGAQDYVMKSEMSARLLEKTVRYAIERHRHAAELQYRNRDLLNFAHTVAHEIRNPLNTIQIGTQVLQKHCTGTLPQDMLALIDRQVKHVSEFVTDMLQFSAGTPQENTKKQADGEACLNAALAGLQSQMKERKVRFSHDKLPGLAVKPIHLQHVFQNLLSNAVKYGQAENPQIHVSAETDELEGFERISVADNGPGIPREDLDKVFSMFSRSGLRPDEPGLGIGLAYCRRVVESYGGKVWVDSAADTGSTFYFTLPRTVGSEQ